MPHTKSAKKSLRQTAKRRERNRAVKRGLKLQLRAVQAAAKAGMMDKLAEEFRKSVKLLDKAAARNVIHRNLAARKKSQLARLVNSKGKPA
jgi:small subunit ribosomal protein S20